MKHNYDNWFENEKSTDTIKGGEEESNDLSSMRTQEGDEEE